MVWLGYVWFTNQWDYVLNAKFQLNWTCFGLVIANFQLGLVWLRFGLARFGLTKFGSKINWIGSSEAACKI